MEGQTMTMASCYLMFPALSSFFSSIEHLRVLTLATLEVGATVNALCNSPARVADGDPATTIMPAPRRRCFSQAARQPDAARRPKSRFWIRPVVVRFGDRHPFLLVAACYLTLWLFQGDLRLRYSNSMRQTLTFRNLPWRNTMRSVEQGAGVLASWQC
ncbi:uncharacterized protein LY79DRAFT_23890 [Colletotrichum navitas]|uniref:Uncharacterized protein n=1 Tax=Colletotrichum navitas TaxID=681940 RepID=A0AAD8QFL7_9PEZI|nr:uncharacterized protein LY79DRAFT_23890 [Colletotrichum navitas]KAK1600552.1 hypothetical protein LY79DRAFT_23890 [Colletotrichum navitas]